MTPKSKSALTRQGNQLAGWLCNRYMTRNLKGSCTGCRLIDAVCERDYPTIASIVNRYLPMMKRDARLDTTSEA